MDGSDKIDSLVIGKLARPRCFRTAGRIPLLYESNSTAWMTGTIWQQWVKSFNSRMKRQNKEVLLFIDNCPGHPTMNGLSHVTIQYLPPQTTFHLQPCDQGIIRCFKRHYRQSLLQEYILVMERKKRFQTNSVGCYDLHSDCMGKDHYSNHSQLLSTCRVWLSC